jgi:hypothetical protein
MAASAANAALTYEALGDNRVLGLATGLAVDIGLCVALIGDRRLYAHGLSPNWGRALRITTAVMSLILNVGISLRDGHYFAALLHSFLPVLLIVLCEYGQDILLQFTALRRQEESTDRAGLAVPTPAEPALTNPRHPSDGWGGAPRTTSAPAPISPIWAGQLLHEPSAPRPEAPSMEDSARAWGGSTSHGDQPATLAPATPVVSPAPASASGRQRQSPAHHTSRQAPPPAHLRQPPFTSRSSGANL